MNRNLIKASALAFGLLTAASHGDEGHDHGSDNPQARQEHDGGGMQDEHGNPGHGGGHQHGKWIDPPEVYDGVRGDAWTDASAIARGESIYAQQCASCHGSDGRGTGPVAGSLSHPPADLTNHFHTAPGEGDAYLFWRVSEGGTVEPFKSQNSAMPAFKNVLDEGQRWDVLAYVHAFFHHGVMAWANGDKANDKGGHDS